MTRLIGIRLYSNAIHVYICIFCKLINRSRGVDENENTIQIYPAVEWSDDMMCAIQAIEADDRLVTSPCLSFKDRPLPLMK